MYRKQNKKMDQSKSWKIIYRGCIPGSSFSITLQFYMETWAN